MNKVYKIFILIAIITTSLICVSVKNATSQDNEINLNLAKIQLEVMKTGNYKSAIEELTALFQNNPKNIRLVRILADCFVAIGNFEEAQEHYKKCIDLYKEKGVSKNDPQILRLEKILEVFPKRYKDISELIVKKRYKEAKALCKKRISLNAADYVAITQLGEIYWEKNKRRMAFKLFKKAVKIAPEYSVAHFSLGRSYFFNKKHDKAIEEFNIFKEKMASLPTINDDTTEFYVSNLHDIVYMYSTLEKYESMVGELRQIIKLKPDDQRAYYNLAVCFYQHRRSPYLAYEQLQKLIEIDKNSKIAKRAEFFIEFIRSNPDPRFDIDYTFMFEDN